MKLIDPTIDLLYYYDNHAFKISYSLDINRYSLIGEIYLYLNNTLYIKLYDEVLISIYLYEKL